MRVIAKGYSSSELNPTKRDHLLAFTNTQWMYFKDSCELSVGRGDGSEAGEMNGSCGWWEGGKVGGSGCICVVRRCLLWHLCGRLPLLG